MGVQHCRNLIPSSTPLASLGAGHCHQHCCLQLLSSAPQENQVEERNCSPKGEEDVQQLSLQLSVHALRAGCPCRLCMHALRAGSLCACCPCSLPMQHTLLPPLQATVVHSSRGALVALGEILDMQTVSDCTQPNIAAVNLVQGYLWCKSLNEKILFASPIACGTAGMVQGWEGAWLQGGSSFGRESLSSIGKP